MSDRNKLLKTLAAEFDQYYIPVEKKSPLRQSGSLSSSYAYVAT